MRHSVIFTSFAGWSEVPFYFIVRLSVDCCDVMRKNSNSTTAVRFRSLCSSPRQSVKATKRQSGKVSIDGATYPYFVNIPDLPYTNHLQENIFITTSMFSYSSCKECSCSALFWFSPDGSRSKAEPRVKSTLAYREGWSSSVYVCPVAFKSI